MKPVIPFTMLDNFESEKLYFCVIDNIRHFMIVDRAARAAKIYNEHDHPAPADAWWIGSRLLFANWVEY